MSLAQCTGVRSQVPTSCVGVCMNLRVRLGSLIPACERQVCLADVSVRVL